MAVDLPLERVYDISMVIMLLILIGAAVVLSPSPVALFSGSFGWSAAIVLSFLILVFALGYTVIKFRNTLKKLEELSHALGLGMRGTVFKKLSGVYNGRRVDIDIHLFRRVYTGILMWTGKEKVKVPITATPLIHIGPKLLLLNKSLKQGTPQFKKKFFFSGKEEYIKILTLEIQEKLLNLRNELDFALFVWPTERQGTFKITIEAEGALLDEAVLRKALDIMSDLADGLD
ncbi:MAG: hypothetical protein J7L23_00170 [Candidatus Diapherotrites archaeon]|nr:hypothetical protein [Candidatus Diapherotrites archaeon]